MATHDYSLANQSGSSFRTDLNNVLAAIVSNNSASSEPSTKYSYQYWADTSSGYLKIRNAANNAWVQLFKLDGTDIHFVNLSGSTNNTICTVTGADAIQGEANLTFDGSTLGVTGNATFSSTIASGDLTITSTAPFISFVDSNQDDDFNIQVNSGVFAINSTTDSATRLQVDSSGNVSCGGITDTQNWGSKFRVGGGYMLVDQGSGAPWVFGKNSADQDFILGRSAADGTITENFRAYANGNLRIGDGDLVVGTAGHGILFSNWDTSTNRLDDYEEGSWTPAMSANASNVAGRYTRIGQMVHASFYMNVGSNSTSSDMLITGLPFTNNDAATLSGNISITNYGANFLIFTDQSGNIYIRTFSNGNIPMSDFSGKWFYGELHYTAN